MTSIHLLCLPTAAILSGQLNLYTQIRVVMNTIYSELPKERDTDVHKPIATIMPLLLRAKCVLVGDSGVGKSAIAQSFHSDGTHFPKAYTMVSWCRVQVIGHWCGAARSCTASGYQE